MKHLEGLLGDEKEQHKCPYFIKYPWKKEFPTVEQTPQNLSRGHCSVIEYMPQPCMWNIPGSTPRLFNERVSSGSLGKDICLKS